MLHASGVEKYSKNDGGLFKITLFAYLQRGWTNDPETPHFGSVFGSKIDPRSRKSRFQIATKIKSIFYYFLYQFSYHLGPLEPPKNLVFLMFSKSCCRSWAILTPKGCPKCSKTAPEVDFSRIWYHFGVNFQRIFKDFQKIFHTTPRLMSIRFYMFHHIKATSFQLPIPIFSCLARWRLFARSALDIRRPRVAVAGRV